LTVIPNAITVTGMVESTSGGFKFPDGSVQTTAATGGGGGGGAPTGASYVVLGLDAALTAERVLTAGTNISMTDGGANGNVTVSTIANPTFSTSVTTPLITNSGALTLRTTATAGADDMIFSTAGTERMRISEAGDIRLTGVHFQHDAGLAAMKVAVPPNSQFVLMDAITDTPRIHSVYAGSWAPTLTVQEAINGVRGFGSLFMPDNGDLYLASGRGITFRTNASDISEADSATDVMTLTTAGNVGIRMPEPVHLIDANLGTLTAQKAGLNIVGTWNNSTVQFAALTMNITDSASGTCSVLADLRVGGSSKFRVHKNGRLIQAKDVSAVVAPGAGYGLLRWENGTNAGTLKLVAYSGTSTTGTVIVDNVGGGN
jgi:hypothetical protein